MADRIRFFYVDVFADRPLTGNPLTVVPDADRLTVERMQAVAREFNQSETTFLLRPGDERARWRLRSFTPAGAEVGGAGHNALGAWLWLADAGLVGAGRFVQQIGDELLPVEVTRDGSGAIRAVLDQSEPSFGAPVADTEGVAAALGLTATDLGDALPVRSASTGVSHLLVPLRGADAVDRVRPDPHALLPILRDAGGEGCYVFSTDAAQFDAAAYARFFNPTVGIAEDPATGTAAGPLAAALRDAGRVTDSSEVVIEQGRAAGRPSRLTVHLDGSAIRLSGSGLVVGEGRLTV